MSSSQSDYLQIERDSAELKRIKQALDALIQMYEARCGYGDTPPELVVTDLMEVRNGN